MASAVDVRVVHGMQEVSGSSPLSSTLFRARVRPKVTISSHLNPAGYVFSWGDFKGCPHALSAKWVARPPWQLLSWGRPRDSRPGTVRRRDRAIFLTIPVLRRHGRRWPDPDRCAGATARDRSLHHRGAPPPAVRRGVEIEQTEGHRRSSWPASDPWRIAAAHSPGRLLEPHTDGTIRRARPGPDRSRSGDMERRWSSTLNPDAD
jgi:hypothetical protein